jgi:hypothetical protein
MSKRKLTIAEIREEMDQVARDRISNVMDPRDEVRNIATEAITNLLVGIGWKRAAAASKSDEVYDAYADRLKISLTDKEIDAGLRSARARLKAVEAVDAIAVDEDFYEDPDFRAEIDGYPRSFGASF